MVRVHGLVIEMGARCIICDRTVWVKFKIGESPVGPLARAGACVVGPNVSGILVVEGCRQCNRWAPAPQECQPKAGGGE